MAIHDALKRAPVRDRARVKSAAITAIGHISKQRRSRYSIEVLSLNAIEGGVEAYVCAWDRSGQIGFGSDGSVEIERFRIFNPPLLVPDEQGNIIQVWRDERGRERTRRLREDPKEALLQVIEHNLSVMRLHDSRNIKRGKVGRTTSTFYSAAGANSPMDAFVRIDLAATGAAWATMRNSGTGGFPSEVQAAIRLRGGTTSNQWRTLDKSVSGFDTSAIGSDAVSAATVSLYGTFKNNTSAYGGLSVAVDRMTPQNANNAEAADANASNWDGVRQSDGDITFAAWSTTGYNDFALNATGISNINTSGLTWLGFRPDVDLDNTEPTWATTESDAGHYQADQAGSTTDPKLVVEHAPASTEHTKTLTETATAAATFARVWTLARTLTETASSAASILKTATKLLVEAVTGADTFTKGLIIASGPRSPGTMAQSTTDGRADWNNPDNAKVSDNSDATANLDAGSLITLTEDLIATNFGFSIPTTATIDGILLEIERARDGGGDPVNDSEVRLIKGGSEVAANKATGTDWGTTDAYASYGGSTDLWGTTWTPSDINASNFGAMLVATSSGANAANVDHIRITVYYTQPGNSYSETYTEAATAAASVLRTTTRTLVESIVAVATFVRVWTSARTYSEAASATATVVKTASRILANTAIGEATLIRSTARNLADAITASDTLETLRAQFRTFTDVAIGTATLVKTAGRTLAEAPQAIGSLIRSIGRILSDTGTTEDTFTGSRARVATLSDSATAAASFIKTTTRTLAEGVIATATTPLMALSRTLAETATGTASIIRSTARTLADTAQATATVLKTASRAFADAAAATDIFLRSITKMLLETPTAADSIIRHTARSLAESATSSATIVRATGRTLTDTISSLDIIAVAATYGRTLTEQASALATFAANILTKMRKGIAVLRTRQDTTVLQSKHDVIPLGTTDDTTIL